MKAVNVAILGMGLIGGSLGLAFREAPGEAIRVTGYARRRETADKALAAGAADSMAASVTEAVRDADFVFLCAPMLQMLPLALDCLPHLKVGAVLTDVGSTKSWLAKKIRPLLPAGIHYIGGHPMAGREKSGIDAATPGLFQQRWYIFTPDPATPPSVLESLRKLVARTGALTAVLDEGSHDRMTAVISHVPHVAAAALVHLLKRDNDPAGTARFVGGGFRDTTRIASSDADMWADICLTNPANIADELDEMGRTLASMAGMIRAGDRDGIHAFFREAKSLRDMVLLQEQFGLRTSQTVSG